MTGADFLVSYLVARDGSFTDFYGDEIMRLEVSGPAGLLSHRGVTEARLQVKQRMKGNGARVVILGVTKISLD